MVRTFFWAVPAVYGWLPQNRATAFIAAVLVATAAGEVARRKPEERSAIGSSVRLLLLSAVAFVIEHEVSSADFAVADHVLLLLWKLLLTAALVKLAGVFLFGVVLPAIRFPQQRIFRDLSLSALYVSAALIVLSRNGMTLSGVLTTSAVITAVIGFSLQDTLGNVMSGVALQMDETLSIGDWIQIDKYTGKVKEIGWRHTAIETRNWDTVFIPNARLMREEVTVLGRQAINPDVVQHRQWVYFNVDFRYAPGEVIATVERALTKGPIDNVAESPAPQCIAMAFEDSWVKYAVRYWLTDLAKDDFTDSLVRQRVYYALARADMPLSLPAQTLFLRQQNSEEREQHQQRELDRRLNALQGVAVFQSLTSDELKTLAGRLHFAPFAKSEVIMRQGTQAHWLYIINSGRAIEEIRDPQGEDHLVTRLNPGDVFGEMSLLTGAPRSATVVAEDPVTCYRLDPEGFRDIIRARPEIGEYMSRVLAERKMQIQEALHHSAHSTAQEVSTLSDELLTRIYSFFNLGTKTGAASKGNGKTSSAKDPGVKSRATGV